MVYYDNIILVFIDRIHFIVTQKLFDPCILLSNRLLSTVDRFSELSQKPFYRAVTTCYDTDELFSNPPKFCAKLDLGVFLTLGLYAIVSAAKLEEAPRSMSNTLRK